MSKSFRVAVVGDLHLREKELDGAEGQRVILDRTCDSIIAAEPTVVLIAGDLAGMRVPHKATTVERNALVAFISRLRDKDLRVVVCRGNHDPRGEFDFLRLGVPYVEGPPVAIHAGGIDIAVIPWRDRTEFPAGADYQAAWREELGGFWKRCGKADVVLAHAAVSGSVVRPGQPNLQTDDPKLTMEQLAPKGTVRAVFAGHYHHHQILPGDTPGWYAGGLFFNEFNEPGPKGWLQWDSDSPKQAVLVNVTQPRRVALTFHAETGVIENADGLAPGSFDSLRDAIVRVDVRGESSTIEKPATDVLHEMEANALAFSARFVSTKTAAVREGSTAVAGAKTNEGKFLRWLETQDPKPAKKTIKRALALLKEMA